MARYIDADALKSNLTGDIDPGETWVKVKDAVNCIERFIDNAPTANIVPISKKQLAETKARAIAEYDQHIKSKVAREIIDEFSKLVTKYVKDRDLYLVVFKNAIANAEAELKKKYTEGKNDGVGEG